VVEFLSWWDEIRMEVGMKRAALGMMLAAALAALAAPGAASADGGDGNRRRDRLSLTSTRDMAFGSITSDANGSLRLPAVSTPMVTASGGVRTLNGGAVSSARFVVQGNSYAPDGTEVVVTLPQSFQLIAGAQTLIAEDVEAALDGAGLNWTPLGAGRYLCTLSGGRKCIFVVGATLRVPDMNQGAVGAGMFRVTVDTLHDNDDDDDD
jgi:Domain of unknown function (DUF4402)